MTILQGRITVSLSRKEGVTELRVSDTGVGIPESEIHKVFDRFHRVEGVHGRSYEGSGIGLALVVELVKLHSGTITLESQVGVGSTFIVRIPAKKMNTTEQVGITEYNPRLGSGFGRLMRDDYCSFYTRGYQVVA